MCIIYKWPPSLNKNHPHGNDIRPFKRKQNCMLSEKGTWTECKIIKNDGNKIKITNAKKQVCPKLLQNPNGWKSFDQPQGSHYRSCSSPRYIFSNNRGNDGTKLGAQTFFMQKRTVQHRKESTYEINWFLGSTSPHQKRCCEQTFKNNDAFVHSPSLAFP